MARAVRPSWSLKRWKITGTFYLLNMPVINGPNGFQQHPIDQLHTAVWKHITTCSVHTVVKNEVVKSENTTPQQCSSRSFEKTHGNFLACASFTIHPALHIQCYVGFKQFKTSDVSPISHQKMDCNHTHHMEAASLLFTTPFYHTIWVRLLLEPMCEGLSTSKLFHHNGLTLQPFQMTVSCTQF